MTARELRKKYINFFVKHGHKEIPGASLIPENDPTALFINSGMHPLVPYLLGESHPLGKRLVDVQKCVRTGDIEEVGNMMHHTFFEMLGNWSLGDYFKEKAIAQSFEFLTKELNLDPKRIHVTVFAGDKNAPRDLESAQIWQKVGIPKERIYFLPKKDNWWEVGETGPCGPDSEMFYDTGKKPCGPDCRPGCHCGKYFEVWNDVFMTYNRTKEGKYEPLAQKNVDTGMGVERTTAMLQGLDDNYQTELFAPIIKKIEEISGKEYPRGVATCLPARQAFTSRPFDKLRVNERSLKAATPATTPEQIKAMRIIADHIRASTFIISDGVVPSNVERGYILRRLIRRAVRQGHLLGIEEEFLNKISSVVVDEYKDLYPELEKNKKRIGEELEKEEKFFSKALSRGLKEFEKVVASMKHITKAKERKKILPGKVAFKLYDTYGFPLELTEELAREKGLVVDRKGYKEAFKKHQEKSRAGVEKKFAGGLVDQSKKVTRLHTATHLLHQALRDVLGSHVQQKGSNITPERLRFDFSHDKKLSEIEIKRISALVNQKIKEDLLVNIEVMTLKEAKKKGALAFFGEKYGEKVKVYSIGPSTRSTSSGRAGSGQAYSKEVCGGPHAKRTGELGHFKILKQESVGRGIRRIKAILEND